MKTDLNPLLEAAVRQPQPIRQARVIAALRNAHQALAYVCAVGADLLPEVERDVLADAALEAGRLADYLGTPIDEEGDGT
jgi:hypothetical protein